MVWDLKRASLQTVRFKKSIPYCTGIQQLEATTGEMWCLFWYNWEAVHQHFKPFEAGVIKSDQYHTSLVNKKRRHGKPSPYHEASGLDFGNWSQVAESGYNHWFASQSWDQNIKWHWNFGRGFNISSQPVSVFQYCISVCKKLCWSSQHPAF